MLKVNRTALGLIAVGIVLIFAMGAMPVQKERPDRPVIKRLSNFRGDHFPGFAEFRVQEFEWDDFKNILPKGEPYEILLNVNYITSAYRYEDGKKTDYSTIMFVNYSEVAIFVRQEYDDVVSSIRKGMEAQVK
jgi:hypothetical protein